MKKPDEHLFSIRMPGRLVKKLDRAAAHAQRSRSAEIRFRLEESLTLRSDRRPVKAVQE